MISNLSADADHELLRIAVAVLGTERVADLRGALEERGQQLERVDAPSTQSRDRQLGEVRPATIPRGEHTDLARRRIDEVDGQLLAFAWRAPDDWFKTRHGTGPSGLLDDFVVAVKDVIDVGGMPTRCGSPLTSGAPASTDAAVVARVRDAGAAVIGKTHCTEWALNDPAPTRNPHDPARTPGGSSAGSAVAVATGMCTVAIDTQTAGDVLRPAAFNGVVGYKPTIGWTPSDGIQPVAPTIDTVGVTARNVKDAATVAAVVADARYRLDASPTPPQRVGVLADPIFASASPVITANLAAVIDQMMSAGVLVEEVRSPVDLAQLHAAHRVITSAECAAEHRARYRKWSHRYGARARELIDLGRVMTATAYLDAQRVRRDATDRLAAFLDEVDLILMPVTPGPAPLRDTTGDSTFQIPWTLGGFPALALPSGQDQGLPLAVQLVASLGHDSHLLACGRWYEEVLQRQSDRFGRI
jgi:Asp-tRNA(Asn)/Glu-tRNA(Gln) amidotransferase A subunit family amidase